MKAAYWTGIGTLLIPIGVLLAVEKPDLTEVAVWLIAAGSISLVAGWVYTIREERQRQKEYKLREEREELRLRGEKMSLLVLGHMAEASGVNMDKIIKDAEKLLDGK